MSLPPEQHTRVLDPVVPTDWLMGLVETWLFWAAIVLLSMTVGMALMWVKKRRSIK
jgi:hypothetical protein